MATISGLSRGNFVRYQGEVARVEEIEHRTPGNLRAFYQIKMRNVRSGKIIENRFRPGDDIELLRVETKLYQYLYEEGESLVCMHNETFEQIYLDKSLVGEQKKYIKENMEFNIAFEDDHTPVTVEIPDYVTLKVTKTEPGLSGDTATRTLKPAVLETGLEIKVPLFINVEDTIKVDTRIGAYVERVK